MMLVLTNSSCVMYTLTRSWEVYTYCETLDTVDCECSPKVALGSVITLFLKVAV